MRLLPVGCREFVFASSVPIPCDERPLGLGVIMARWRFQELQGALAASLLNLGGTFLIIDCCCQGGLHHLVPYIWVSFGDIVEALILGL